MDLTNSTTAQGQAEPTTRGKVLQFTRRSRSRFDRPDTANSSSDNHGAGRPLAPKVDCYFEAWRLAESGTIVAAYELDGRTVAVYETPGHRR